MPRAGLIGGVAPESTIIYYRSIIARYRERSGDGSYPPLVINSIDLAKMLALVAADQRAELTDYLVGEVQSLASAGATFGALASNTPHLVFDEVAARSPIPLVSIVESACQVATALHLGRVALFGTRFTMQARFYSDVFARAGLTILAPTSDEQSWIHDAYMGELVQGVIRDETRDTLVAIARRMRDRDGVEALLLGGTELSLIVDASHLDMPVLDTTRIHVERIVDRMLSAP